MVFFSLFIYEENMARGNAGNLNQRNNCCNRWAEGHLTFHFMHHLLLVRQRSRKYYLLFTVIIIIIIIFQTYQLNESLQYTK